MSDLAGCKCREARAYRLAEEFLYYISGTWDTREAQPDSQNVLPVTIDWRFKWLPRNHFWLLRNSTYLPIRSQKNKKPKKWSYPQDILETRTKRTRQVFASSYSSYNEGLKQQAGINLRRDWHEAVGKWKPLWSGSNWREETGRGTST